MGQDCVVDLLSRIVVLMYEILIANSFRIGQLNPFAADGELLYRHLVRKGTDDFQRTPAFPG